jgi:hypothetical protein
MFLLGTVIEQNGDTAGRLINASWMATAPRNGAVKQWRVQRTATCQELTDFLGTCDMKRDLLELNYKAAQWGYGAVKPIPIGRCVRCGETVSRKTDINKKVTSCFFALPSPLGFR